MNLYILDYDNSIINYYSNFFRLEFPKIEIKFFNDKVSFLESIQKNVPDFVITEFEIDQPFELFKILKEKNICFLVISRLFNERVIVESLKHGAYDFIHKSNLKLDYLKIVISRVLLDIPRWKDINSQLSKKPYFPEFEKYDNQLIQLALELSNLGELNQSKFPDFIEGKSYKLNFLTVKIVVPDQIQFFYSEEEIQKLHLEWIQKLTNIVQGNGGLIWLKKSDSFTAVFPENYYLLPIICALKINAEIIQILVNLELESLKLVCAMDHGSVVYRQEKENLYSESINLTYHMIDKLPPDYPIYITENIYKKLNPREKSYFFKEEYNFEGNEIYHFEYVS